MKRTFTILALVCATMIGAIGLIAVTADAANQQLGAPYFLLTRTQTYARSDGLALHRASKTPVLVGNGDGFQAIGPTYRQTFEAGDAQGISCECIRYMYINASGANTSCVTTCGALTPDAGSMLGFEAALADAGDILSPSDGTADACLCETPDRFDLESGDPDCDGTEGSTGNVFLVRVTDGVTLAWHPIVVQEIAPDMDADGLDIGGDQTDDDGGEIYGGMHGATGRPFTVGTDPAFEFCVEIDVSDVSGADDLRIGFRGVEMPNATFDNYQDVVSIGLIGTAASGLTEEDIWIETIDDDAATVPTDTTDSLTEDVDTEFCVLVSDAGVVTYTIDGQAPTVTAAVTLDDGLQVIPFVHFLNTSDLADEIVISKWEVTYQ